jgi:hypothetical protein
MYCSEYPTPCHSIRYVTTTVNSAQASSTQKSLGFISNKLQETFPSTHIPFIFLTLSYLASSLLHSRLLRFESVKIVNFRARPEPTSGLLRRQIPLGLSSELEPAPAPVSNHRPHPIRGKGDAPD